MKKHTFKGGLHMFGRKEKTQNLHIISVPAPAKVYIPLSQHIGAPCLPLVKVGDMVKLGQKIGEGQGFVTAPVHASVSGMVLAVENRVQAGGKTIPCIVIENDGKEERSEDVAPRTNTEILSGEELRKIIFEAGIVGLGGAAFPSHVKYSPVKGKKAQVVILNGAECELQITCDHRIMLERPERVVMGLRYIMKSVDCSQGIIAVEENKMDAVKELQKAVSNDENIQILILKEKYPQGSEKQLIFSCIGKEVPEGGLPLDVGVIVNNVGTASAIADAVELGRPLIERVLTLSGEGIGKPANYLVRIGMLLKDVVTYNGGYNGETAKIIAGGLMMGRTVFTDEISVTKGSSGFIIQSKEDAFYAEEHSCVRCGKCVKACPIYLEPTTIVKFLKRGRWEEAANYGCMSCIECGLCTYICPANIPLIEYIRRGKQLVLSNKAKSAAK